MTSTSQRTDPGAGQWFRRVLKAVAAGMVATVAAYASYQHQRDFALGWGADSMSAALWPLSVDGLLIVSTLSMVADTERGRKSHWSTWLGFIFGVVVSLASNIAAAHALTWQSILVAGWPPVALLLVVELLTRGTSGHTRTAAPLTDTGSPVGEPPSPTGDPALTRSPADNGTGPGAGFGVGTSDGTSSNLVPASSPRPVTSWLTQGGGNQPGYVSGPAKNAEYAEIANSGHDLHEHGGAPDTQKSRKNPAKIAPGASEADGRPALVTQSAESGVVPVEREHTGTPPETAPESSGLTAKERARRFWDAERAAGRTPSGAQLDEVAGTRDYGRKLVRQWLDETTNATPAGTPTAPTTEDTGEQPARLHAV